MRRSMGLERQQRGRLDPHSDGVQKMDICNAKWWLKLVKIEDFKGNWGLTNRKWALTNKNWNLHHQQSGGKCYRQRKRDVNSQEQEWGDIRQQVRCFWFSAYTQALLRWSSKKTGCNLVTIRYRHDLGLSLGSSTIMGPYITDKSAIVGYHTHEISLKSIKIHQHPLKSHEHSITLVSLGLNLPLEDDDMAGPSQLEVELEFLRQDPTTLERRAGVQNRRLLGGVDDHGLTMV